MSDNNQNRFNFSSPSINNIIDSATGYVDLNDPAILEAHTGWTPLIKQTLAGGSASNNNRQYQNLQVPQQNQMGMDQSRGNNGEMCTRSNSIGTQYQQLWMGSSPLKTDSHGLMNLEKLLALESELMENNNNNNNNNNYPILLSNTPLSTRSNSAFLHDLFIDTPNLSNNINNNNNNNINNNNALLPMESPTKLMQQSLLLSAHKNRLTPFKLNPQNQPMLYPDTPGTKLMKSLLDLPMNTTPLPSSTLSKLKNKGGSPLKESTISTEGAVNITPLTKKAASRKKRKAPSFETPQKRSKQKKNSNSKIEAPSFTPPAKIRGGNGEGSSPSTIKVNSVSPTAKMKNKAMQQMSPTPALHKVSAKNTQSNEPDTFGAPPIGTFKQKDKQSTTGNSLLTSSSSTSRNNTSTSTTSNNTKGGKFQIIFQDMNSLMKKSLLKSKKARSKSGVLQANNNKKNRLSRSMTFTAGEKNLPTAGAPPPGPHQFENKENEFMNNNTAPYKSFTDIPSHAQNRNKTTDQNEGLTNNIREGLNRGA